MRVVVAGFGNILRGDDGFGVEVVRALAGESLPSGVVVMDVGIGGIHLVQELLDGAEALVVVDAVDLGRAPGTVLVLRPEVAGPRMADPHEAGAGDLSVNSHRDELADTHYATPQRALMLAAGLGVLPAITMLVGCQPVDAETFAKGLSAPVARAVAVAAEEVRRVVTEAGVPWEGWSSPPALPPNPRPVG